MTDVWRAMKAQIDAARLAVPAPNAVVRIRVTEWAIPGSIVDTPEVEGKRYTGKRELLIHHDDWQKLVNAVPVALRSYTKTTGTLVFGIPVEIDPLPNVLD